MKEKINQIIKLVESLKSEHKFFDKDNKEDFLDEIECIVVSLEELEDIVDRDKEYKYAASVISHE